MCIRDRYVNLMANRRVAMFIDNRENVGSDTEEAVAVTALGEAEEVAGDEGAGLRHSYLARHPYLAVFATSPSCAVMRVRVKSYLVVRRFQEVEEWRLGPQGPEAVSYTHLDVYKRQCGASGWRLLHNRSKA